jgi:hypothetical protein
MRKLIAAMLAGMLLAGAFAFTGGPGAPLATPEPVGEVVGADAADAHLSSSHCSWNTWLSSYSASFWAYTNNNGTDCSAYGNIRCRWYGPGGYVYQYVWSALRWAYYAGHQTSASAVCPSGWTRVGYQQVKMIR